MDYVQLYDKCTKECSTNLSELDRKIISASIENIKSWTDLYINRIEKERNQKEYLNSLSSKPIQSLNVNVNDDTTIFKNDDEIKSLIFYHWFAYLLKYRAPQNCDGKTLRKHRRKLLSDIEKGRLVNKKSIDTLKNCFNKLKNL